MNRQQRRRNCQETERPDSLRNATLVLAAVLAVAVGVFAVQNESRHSSLSATEHDTTGPVPGFTAETLQIAGSFICGCESCSEHELATCACPSAIEEKKMIQAALSHGTPRMISTLQARYGGLKEN